MKCQFFWDDNVSLGIFSFTFLLPAAVPPPPIPWWLLCSVQLALLSPPHLLSPSSSPGPFQGPYTYRGGWYFCWPVPCKVGDQCYAANNVADCLALPGSGRKLSSVTSYHLTFSLCHLLHFVLLGWPLNFSSQRIPGYTIPTYSRIPLFCSILLGCFDSWRWDHYVVSKHWETNTLWCIIIFQKKQYVTNLTLQYQSHLWQKVYRDNLDYQP